MVLNKLYYGDVALASVTRLDFHRIGDRTTCRAEKLRRIDRAARRIPHLELKTGVAPLRRRTGKIDLTVIIAGHFHSQIKRRRSIQTGNCAHDAQPLATFLAL